MIQIKRLSQTDLDQSAFPDKPQTTNQNTLYGTGTNIRDMNQTRTWILVADGGRARILETTGKRQEVHAVVGSESRLDNPPSRELGRDAPGRVYESVGSTRHAVEPRRDPHKALEALFASQLATMLADYSARESFDRLIVVAPATMLGNLRKMIQPQVREKIIAEIDKDLTRVPNNEIASHVERAIGV
jgi:protein required for attachment to host cells